MKGIYYTAPPDEAFEDMKQVCMDVWATMDNQFGYVDEKQARIKEIKNVEDNFMYMLAMFDQGNQAKVVELLKFLTQTELRLRMIDGGNSPEEMMRIGL